MEQYEDLSLSRQDIHQVGPLSKKTIRVFPVGENRLQKVVVGDDLGNLQVFTVRKGEVIIKGKAVLNKEITAIDIAGFKGKKDKIFVANGANLRTFNKAGKELMVSESTITETIKFIASEGNSVWTAGNYTLLFFADGIKDTRYFMSNDRINDLICENLSSDAETDAVLACQDRVIRFIQGTDIMYDIAVDGPATILDKQGKRKKTASNDKEILFGTSNGFVGQLFANNTEVQRGWTISNDEQVSGIQSITTVSISGDGTNDIVVGREDGSLEVYTYSEILGKPKLLVKKTVNESIQSLSHGYITNPDKEDIILGTHSGKIITFSQSSSTSTESFKKSENIGEKKTKALLSEIEKLKERVVKQQEKYKWKYSQEIVATSTFKVTEKFTLSVKDASYILSIEVNASLDCLILQSNVKIDIEDLDKNTSITSKTPSSSEDGNEFLATCRVMEDQVNRVQLRVFTTEGQHGLLQIFVIPKVSPKTANVLSYQVKPLSLHYRVNEEDLNAPLAQIEQWPLNEMIITGNFSFAEVHSWVCLCLPDLSDRMVSEDVEVYFRSCFTGTLLLCSYRKDKATFKSESLATLFTLKEVISKEATSRGNHFNINLVIREESVNMVLELIHPKVDALLSLAKKAKVIDALRELKITDEDLSYMSQEYLEVLENAEWILQKFKEQPKQLSYIYNVIEDLYVAKLNLKGINGKGKSGELKRILDNYRLESLKEFFALPVASSSKKDLYQ